MSRLSILVFVVILIAAMAGRALAENSLTVSSAESGEVTIPGEGAFAYDTGTVVDLAAVAEDGYYFVNWSGDVGTVANVFAAATTVTVDADYSIVANFAQGSAFSLNPDVGGAIRGDIGERGYLFPSDVQDHNPFH